MAEKKFDRVKETSTTSGTGNLTVAGAVAGFQAFADVLADGDTFKGAIVHKTAAQWESGLYTYVAATPAIARTHVFESSNSDAIVDFSAGTKEIFIGKPAKASPEIDPRQNDFRLTLTTAVPVTISDVTGAATLYWTPFKGRRFSLYDGYAWIEFAASEISIALTGLIKGVQYDVFCYDNAGTPTLELLAWKKVTATNSPTAGSAKVINIADTSSLVVGMRVTVRDGSASEIAYITAIVANTSITVATLANSYTLPDVYGFKTRATDLTTQDGVYVKTGATTRRYIGTISISGTTTGQTEDSAQRRLVWNADNQVVKAVRYAITTASWTTVTSATIRQQNADRANQVEFTVGLQINAIQADNHATATNSTGTVRQVSAGLALNNITAFEKPVGTTYTFNGGDLQCIGRYVGAPSIGFNYLAAMEQGNAAETQTWKGGSNYGISGTWLC